MFIRVAIGLLLCLLSPVISFGIPLPGDLPGPPYVLNQAGATYTLTEDVSAPGQAITISSKGITLDLADHTITYDQIGGGVPNYSFEDAGGSPEVPASWDLSQAPAAKRVSTFENALVGRWYLQLQAPQADQTVISDWTALPADSKARVHFVRDNPSYSTYIPIKLEAEREGEGIVAGMYSHTGYYTEFKTAATSGRYRVRLTYKHIVPSIWTPNTLYAVGGLIRPSTETDAIYRLKTSGEVSTAASGSTEPVWNTELGGITSDGNVEWITSAIESSDRPSLWEPNKKYALENYVRPANASGCIYTVYRLHLAGAISGPQEPNWTKPPGNVATADAGLSWDILARPDVDLDLIDIRLVGIHGIVAFDFAAGKTDLTIKNGTIRQGAGGGFGSHALYLYGLENAAVENISLETGGIESAAIMAPYSSYLLLKNNRAVTNGLHKFNRHQLSAAFTLSPEVTHSTLENNEIHSGEGWGGILTGGSSNLVQGNQVFTKSVITNHYGIMASGQDNIVRGNLIDADPGQGLRLDYERNLAEDNDIVIRSVAPNHDIWRYSLDGIRINDYYNGYNHDITIRNNRITIYGENSPHYKAGMHYVNGICNVTNGAGMLYEGNTIRAVKVDPEVIVTGIMPGSKDEQVIWKDNTITSDQYGIFFGHYAVASLNARFIGTRFIKGENAGADYAVLAGQTSQHIENVRNTVFLDTIVEGGGTLRTIIRDWNAPTRHRINWSVDISVKTPEGAPINGAKVTITDKHGNKVFEGSTGASGSISGLELTQTEVVGQYAEPEWSYHEYSPYTVSANINSVSLQKKIDLTRPLAITLSVAGDFTAPDPPGGLRAE